MLMILLVVASGCLSSRQTIQPPYPQLESADRCLEFFKLAARLDDPAAGYHCLSEGTREQISFSDFFTGWAWYREYFELFGQAQIVERKPVAPGELLTLQLIQLREPFLFVQEARGWRLQVPSRYNQRSLEDLFAELKKQGEQSGQVRQRTRPERRGG